MYDIIFIYYLFFLEKEIVNYSLRAVKLQT